ncbi:fucolectin-like [Acanthaster planci]|uniref:Fucolectin-like n=1 Tax=Acanthaster planci TaxID=133434 RepID=A0A8B7ZM34_ACAPL|nr:fucolectin-like [Acanthaster planci]
MKQAESYFLRLCAFSKDFYTLFLIIQFFCTQPVYGGFKAVLVSGKPTWQSTTYSSSYHSHEAIDGDRNSFAHTRVGGDPHPWWKIDLQKEHCLGKVTVLIRLNCCGYRFIGAVVRAGLSENYAENRPCGSPATSAQSQQGASIDFFSCTEVSQIWKATQGGLDQ